MMIERFSQDGGGQEIRTLERVAPLHAFQACAFDHSANPPLLRTLFLSDGIILVYWHPVSGNNAFQ